MADWNGFKKNGTTYIPNDATARASISTIEGKIPNGTTLINPLINQSTMETALDGKADVGNVTSLSESVSDIEDKIPSNASSSNQLATRSEVSAAYKPKGNATLATLPPLTTANLNNVYNMTEDFTTTADFAEGAGISVKAGNEVGIINIATDPDALIIKYTVLGGFIDLSEYATQASVISALANKVDKVTGKGLSTNDYDNTAKAVVTTAQDNIKANTKLIKDTVGWSGKNIFDFASFVTTAVRCTYTFTKNTGTYFLTVTDASDNAQVQIVFNNDILRKYAGKDVRISIASHTKSNPNMVPYVALYKNNALVGNFGGNGIPNSSFTFTVPSIIESSDVFLFVIRANQNQSASVNDTLTITGLMASLADILDDTYEPYFGSTAFPRSEQAVLGAKNLLPNNNTTQTINGIPFTKNADGSVTIGAGTASANTSYILSDIKPKAGNYILSRGTTNGQAFLSLSKYNGSTWVAGLVEIGNQAISEKEFTVDYSGYDTLRGFIYIGSGVTISTPYTVYPMVRLATDPDDTYAPYAMTNKELTEKVAITDYEIVSNSGLVFVFFRSGNVVTVNISGESTSAFANDANIVAIPEKYRFYRTDNLNIISYEMVNSLVKLLMLSSGNIKANTPIAVGDKLRGSFSYITS